VQLLKIPVALVHILATVVDVLLVVVHFANQLLKLLLFPLIRLGHEIVFDVVSVVDLLLHKGSQHFFGIWFGSTVGDGKTVEFAPIILLVANNF
jgi:hypothetical protein